MAKHRAQPPSDVVRGRESYGRHSVGTALERAFLVKAYYTDEDSDTEYMFIRRRH